MSRMSVEIAGGGIGGLVAAAAFAQRGWRVRVHERQAELRTVGAGIYLWENGLTVLEAIGAYDAATAGTHKGVNTEYRLGGEIIAQWAINEGSGRVYSVPREQLLKAAADAASRAGAEILTSSEVVDVSPDGAITLGSGPIDLSVAI